MVVATRGRNKRNVLNFRSACGEQGGAEKEMRCGSAARAAFGHLAHAARSYFTHAARGYENKEVTPELRSGCAGAGRRRNYTQISQRLCRRGEAINDDMLFELRSGCAGAARLDKQKR